MLTNLKDCICLDTTVQNLKEALRLQDDYNTNRIKFEDFEHFNRVQSDLKDIKRLKRDYLIKTGKPFNL